MKPRKQISAGIIGKEAPNPYLRTVKSRGETYQILTFPGDTSCYGVKHWEDYDLADLDPVFMKKLEETNGLPKNPNFDVEAYRAKFARKPEELAVQDTDVLDNGAGGSCSGSAAHNDSDPPAEGSPSAAAGGVLLHPLFGDSLKSMFKDFQLMGAEQREQTVKHAIEVFFTSLDPEAQKSEGKLTEKKTNESESANDICVDVVTDDMGFLQVEAKPVKNDGNFV